MGKEWDKLSRNLLHPDSNADQKRKEKYASDYRGRRSNLPDLGGTGEYGEAMQKWHEQWLRECFRVLKPGGYLLAFGGSRTYHRLAAAVEDAGLQVCDQVMWIYGSGFPKSLNVGKAIDRNAGAVRKVVGYNENINVYDNRHAFGDSMVGKEYLKSEITEPATDDAKKWDGWGTALKPAHEPIIVARKPISDGSNDTMLLREGMGRFIYCAKPNKNERNAGLDGLPTKRPDTRTTKGMGTFEEKGVAEQRNHHPTVKPIELMRHLIRLVTPVDGTVVDPFLGSGTTAVAAILEKRNWIGCEVTPDYYEIIDKRIIWANSKVTDAD